MKRRATLVVALILPLLLLAGVLVFAGGEPEEEVIELTFWVQRDEFIPVDGFEPFYADNPDIRVNVETVDPADMASQLALATQAGQAPDITMHGSEEVPMLAEAGLIQAVDGYMDAFREDFPETYNALGDAAWQAASYQGNLYGIAVSSSPRFVYYRQDWFIDAGLPAPPETTQDVLEAARLLLKKGTIRSRSSVIAGCCRWTSWQFSGLWVENITMASLRLTQRPAYTLLSSTRL